MTDCEHKIKICGSGQIDMIADIGDALDMKVDILPISLEARLYKNFYGIVKDHETCIPISNASLRFTNGKDYCSAKTDSCGMFRVLIPQNWKSVSIIIKKEGYNRRYIGSLFWDYCPREFLLYTENDC